MTQEYQPTYAYRPEAETTTLPDGTKIHALRYSRVRTNIQPLSPELSAAIRARNRQTPPKPNTPEHFYRRERFGPSDSPMYHAPTTDKGTSAQD